MRNVYSSWIVLSVEMLRARRASPSVCRRSSPSRMMSNTFGAPVGLDTIESTLTDGAFGWQAARNRDAPGTLTQNQTMDDKALIMRLQRRK